MEQSWIQDFNICKVISHISKTSIDLMNIGFSGIFSFELNVISAAAWSRILKCSHYRKQMLSQMVSAAYIRR